MLKANKGHLVKIMYKINCGHYKNQVEDGTNLSLYIFLGRGTGIFVLGPLMDSIGYRWSFRIASFIAIVTFIFYLIVQRFMAPVKLKSHSDVEKNDEAKEHLQPENEEIKKPPVENGIEVKNSMAGENERNNNPEDPWIPR